MQRFRSKKKENKKNSILDGNKLAEKYARFLGWWEAHFL